MMVCQKLLRAAPTHSRYPTPSTPLPLVLMDQWKMMEVVDANPDKLSGALRFRGTRVPVAALFENRRDGATIEQFLEWFPGVTREQVDAVLDVRTRDRTLSPACPPMKVLFAQGTPNALTWPIRRLALSYELGWSTLRNGDLLMMAEQHGFDLFVTTDQNLRYQQTLSERPLAILVLGSTSWPRICAAVESISAAVDEAARGSFQEIPILY